MAAVTIPGSSGSIEYNSPYNFAVAQQITGMLASASGDSTLVVSSSDDPPALPPGSVGEIAVTSPGATNIVVPAGYAVTFVSPSATGPLTISGGGSLVVGDQSTTYYDSPGPTPVTIAAGNGDNLLGMPSGSAYLLALGDGNDTVAANGSGTLTGGTGNNLFFVGGSANDQNVVNSYGNDTIAVGAGTSTITSYGANPVVSGGSGSLVYIGSSPGAPTISGGSGTETLFGGDGQNITYTDGSSTTPGANILVAGAGNETLNAAGASYGVQMGIGPGSVTMTGSTGDDIFYGGSGAATITGNGGSDTYIFGDIAGHMGGNVTITDWSSSDLFETSGLGATAAQDALNAATVSGGNTVLTLPDGSTITFLNTTPDQIHSQSF
jgi:Ca2+-binding RTX toxin-like protein